MADGWAPALPASSYPMKKTDSMKKLRPTACWLALLGMAASPVLAQTDAGALLNQQQQQRPQPPRQFGAEELIRAQRPPLQVAGGVEVQIKHLRFGGATTLLPADWLQALATESAGRRYDFAGLQALAQRVTDELRARGWMLARAYLPQQELAGGELEIVLLAGRIDMPVGAAAVQIVPGPRGLRLQSALLERMAAQRLEGHAALREAELERVMLLVNDLPGVSARARLEPGAAADSTRVHVDIEEGPLLTGLLWADNFGSRDTGLAQANAQLSLNDASGQGEQLSAQLTRAEDSWLLRLNARRPLGPDGLRANLSASRMAYRLKRGIGAVAGMEGSSQTLNGGLSYPFLRSRLQNFSAALDFSHKQLRDDAHAGNLRDKRLETISASLSGDRVDQWGGGGFSSWSTAVTVGHVDLARNAGDAFADLLGYQSAGGFEKLGLNLSRMQRLAPQLSLYGAFNAQLAGKNLDSSEKIILGGPSAVRAYAGSEGQGDSGWFGTLELRYDWPTVLPWGALQLQGFVDAGQVRLHQDPRGLPLGTATGRNSYGLAGAGLGLNLSKPGTYLIRLSLAQALGRNPGRSGAGLNADGLDARQRGWVQALWWF